MPKGVYADIPRRQQLQHWDRVCCYMEAQPFRAIAFPFPADPPISAKLLKRMEQYKLVRHCDDCTWRVSRRWMQILKRLAKGIKDEPRERSSDSDDVDLMPFVVDTGVDTLYVSLFGEEVPTALVDACDFYKELAQEEDTTVETDWRFFDAPLSMYKAGVGTAKGGKGVSWSFLLRNAYVQILLRRTPLNGLFGSVRLSAECLWTFGARGALDGMRDALDTMWRELRGGDVTDIRFQLSQIHLCADVANFCPSPADLDRVLTRSIKKSVYVPSVLEESASDPSSFSSSDDWDAYEDSAFLSDGPWAIDAIPPEWEGVPVDFYEDNEDEDEDADSTMDEGDHDEAPADEEGAATYLWGQRASGFAFSQGGDLSATWYDKALEERLSGKLWMRPIHEAGGWQSGMTLFRIEARFHRGILRALGAAHARNVEEVERWFDDPWCALQHLQDLWAYYAGLPPEADTAPDVTYRGWMRLAVPDAEDQRRARWLTDTAWEVIQRAQFNPDPPTALKRLPQKRHDLNQVDAELYGLLKLRAALREEYLSAEAELADELGDFLIRMVELDVEKGRNFAEEVREKARMLGKSIPMRLPGTTVPRRIKVVN